MNRNGKTLKFVQDLSVYARNTKYNRNHPSSFGCGTCGGTGCKNFPIISSVYASRTRKAQGGGTYISIVKPIRCIIFRVY